MKLVLISGLSGSGKSVALKSIEDLGYYCVDNLPLGMLNNLIQWHNTHGNIDKLAISVDSRSGQDFAHFEEVIKKIAQSNDVKVLFLDTQDDVLIRRFSETRRLHPLTSQAKTLSEAISQEREILFHIRNTAYVLDTSTIAPQDLRNHIRQWLKVPDTQNLLILESFGFKYGLPMDVDFVFDVRSLPNPFWFENLREFTGRDQEIQQFFNQYPLVEEMCADINCFLQKWLRQSFDSSKQYLTVGIGCTGGKHRSVYIVERLAELFKEQYSVVVRHRQL